MLALANAVGLGVPTPHAPAALTGHAGLAQLARSVSENDKPPICFNKVPIHKSGNGGCASVTNEHGCLSSYTEQVGDELYHLGYNMCEWNGVEEKCEHSPPLLENEPPQCCFNHLSIRGPETNCHSVEDKHECLTSYKERVEHNDGYQTCIWNGHEGKCEAGEYLEDAPPKCCYNHADTNCEGVKHEQACLWSFKERVDHGDGYEACTWNSLEEKCEAGGPVLEDMPSPRCCLDEVDQCVGIEEQHVCLHSFKARLDARGYREGYNTCAWSEEVGCHMEWSEAHDYEPPVECRPASPGYDPTADGPTPCFNHVDTDCAGVKHEEACVWSYKERPNLNPHPNANPGANPDPDPNPNPNPEPNPIPNPNPSPNPNLGAAADGGDAAAGPDLNPNPNPNPNPNL